MAIDEKKLIEDIDNCVVGLTNIQIMQIADIIESQQKVGEWIPCSGCSDCKHKECEHHGKI